MAGSVGDISIKVVANAAGVDVGLKKAEASLKNFSGAAKSLGVGNLESSFIKATSSLTGFGSALTGLSVGLGAAVGIGASIKNTLEYLDSIGDRAGAIGDTTENLSQLNYIAERLGSSAEAVDNAMSKMTKSIGKAASEGGKAEDKFRAIGLSSKYLSSLRPSEAFIAIAAAIAELPTPYEKAAAASEIFGKGAVDVLSIMNASGEEIAAYAQRYDDLGGTVDSATAKIGGDAKDAIGDISVAVQGLENAFIAAFGEKITNGANKLAEGIAGLAQYEPEFHQFMDGAAMVGDFLDDWMSFAGIWDAIAGSIKSIAGLAGSVSDVLGLSTSENGTGFVSQKKIDKWRLRGAAGNKAGQDIARRVEEMNKGKVGAGLALLQEGADQMEKGVNKSLDSVTKSEQKVKDAAPEMGASVVDASEGAAESLDDGMGNSLKDNLEQIQENKDEAKALDDEYKKLQDDATRLTDQVKTPWEKYQEAFDKANTLLEEGLISQETYIRAGQKAWEDLQKAVNGDTPGYKNLSVTGGDMPGMFSPDPAYDRFMQYNTLPGGYVGNLAPNIPSFTPPEWGSRQAGPSAYGDAGYGMDTNNELLNTIARNTRDQGVYA